MSQNIRAVLEIIEPSRDQREARIDELLSRRDRSDLTIPEQHDVLDDLRRTRAHMAVILDDTLSGAPLEQVARERVAQHVRVDLERHPGLDASSLGPSAIARAVSARQAACRLDDVHGYWLRVRSSPTELQELIEAVWPNVHVGEDGSVGFRAPRFERFHAVDRLHRGVNKVCFRNRLNLARFLHSFRIVNSHVRAFA